MNINTSKSRFRKINLFTIISLFVVILAGGVVRSSGSGMGCPDWPKCFGLVIPPTSVNQLPKDYKDKYVKQRVAKNQRFAKVLDLFGNEDLARRIREDRSILVPEDFNAAKTWTEYANRLVGVIAGIFMILTVVYSFRLWSFKKRIALLSILNLILVGYQGWLGSIVVSTNLVPWVVTVHMLLALAILAVAIYTYHVVKVGDNPRMSVNPILHVFMLAALIISCLQIVFGTEVRERIDTVAPHLQDYREDWVNTIGAIFYRHRDVAIIVLVVNLLLYALMRRTFSRHSVQQQLMSFSFLIIMLQIVSGVILSYLSLPPYAQTIHIVLASLMFGTQFYLMLNLYRTAGRSEVLA